MNKTVNINLGGMFFHIDEDAYQKLTRYFDAIKRSLSNSTGQDEILKDIEMRIAELVSEKHTSDKQVINITELDEIIAVMGQPEDYRIADEDAAPAPTYNYSASKNRKLYRDTEGGMVGGVLAGLGHYFGIDKVWLRIIFLVLIISYGIGLLAYLILWIVMPEAVTTAEKLEMRGEPVTISNIEKKVREEFENVGDRLKNAGYDKMGNQVRTGVGRAAGNIGDVITSIAKIFAKILGAFIVVFSSVTLIGMIVGMFTLSSTSFVDVPWQNYVDAVNYTDFPLWIIAMLIFLAAGIPFFFLFLLGLKLLVNNLRPIGNIARYTLLALWLIAVGLVIALGVKQATETAFEGKTVQKQTLVLTPSDTLQIKFRYNDYYAKGVENHEDFFFTQNENDKEVIYSNDVKLHILKSSDKTAYIQIEKQAQGKTLPEAKQRAEKITYTFAVEGNTIILDNYLTTETANKFRDQEVEIFIYLPEGTLFRPDSSIQDYDDSDNSFFNLHHSGNYLYQVVAEQVKCLDCPPYENEYGDVINGDDMGAEAEIEMDADTTQTTTVTVDQHGVKITNGDKTEIKKVKHLEIGENGVIIKTE